MRISLSTPEIKKRSVNLTVREDIWRLAKSLELNASQAAEQGLIQAIRESQEAEWLTENQAAIEAHNKRIKAKGLILKPHWDEN